MDKLKIYVSRKDNHALDTYREMFVCWAELGYVELLDSPDFFCWAVEPGKVLLYDRDRLDVQLPAYKLGLFCNDYDKSIPNSMRWNYCVRYPDLIERHRRKECYVNTRRRTSIFLGRVENYDQLHSRFRANNNWGEYIQVYVCDNVILNPKIPHLFSPDEYCTLLKGTKFGLCLPGYGSRCQRDLEYLALGVIPIKTPGCDFEGYSTPLIENTHYISVNSPTEIERKIYQISSEVGKRDAMCAACFDWYDKNCSVDGSFNHLKRLIWDYL